MKRESDRDRRRFFIALTSLLQVNRRAAFQRIRRVENDRVRGTKAGNDLDVGSIIAADRNRNQIRAAVAHHADAQSLTPEQQRVGGIVTERIVAGSFR